MDKKLIADLNGDIDDLRARLQAAEAERAAAQKERDDASKIAMTANAEAVRYMKERDEAREGAAYTLVGKLDAMAKERDEATARWKSVSDKLVDSWSERDKLQDDLAAAKAESARAEVEALTIVRDNIINLRSSYSSASPESVALKRVVVLLNAILNDDKLRGAAESAAESAAWSAAWSDLADIVRKHIPKAPILTRRKQK